MAAGGRGARRRAGRRGRPRPLVVLPAVTWQGRNPFDSDLDGFADTLDEVARSVPGRAAVPAAAACRGASAREVSPLLRFLDRERLAYDLTTDLALARREGPAIGNAPGVAIAGTADLAAAPRARPAAATRSRSEGSAVASFGARVAAPHGGARSAGVLRNPSPPRPDDLFGERTSVFASDPPAPLREESTASACSGRRRAVRRVLAVRALGPRCRPMPSCSRRPGREEGEPAFVAYRLGKGTVIRPGTPQWARAARGGRAGRGGARASRKRIWALLSKRR